MNVAVLIPARYPAVRLPGKPLLKIAGRELLGHVLDRCRSAFSLPIYVATDDARILDFLKHEKNVTGVMTSPSCPNGTARIQEACHQLGAQLKGVDLILHVQGDEPLLSTSMLQTLHELRVSTPKHVGLVTLAAPLADHQKPEDSSIVKVVCDRAGYALYFSRYPIPFPHMQPGPHKPLGHVGLYAWTLDALKRYVALEPTPLEVYEGLEQLRWMEHGGRIKVGRIDSMPHGVNTPEDVKIVEELLKKQ